MNGLALFEARCRAMFKAKPKKADALEAALLAQGLRHHFDAIEAGDAHKARACQLGLDAVRVARLTARSA